ncbi:SpoIIE family protein phosphatase [Paracrocinitomix mangrovi]|uniref:SpoIIE family protein phosphatase n=1 Tax=Paracrocinitomix mangrovi TaxID=2862509 RepID=UPI001C8D903A|nr:SpoIIE family protein phosphatase [Paracrocinitomix mangrovi]UKN00521.1 SpoIIE family protein phosphatase [Paracrocinitomix mangrovi]
MVKKFNDLNINIKLALAFFVIAFSSIVIIGFLAYFKGKKSLEEESFNRLTAVREMKASQIEDYFKDIRNQIITFSEDHTIIEAMKDFRNGFHIIYEEVDYNEHQKGESEKRLEDYYNNEFLPRLNQNVEILGDIEHHFPTHPSSVLLQDLYIASNKNKVGEKHFLEDAGDGSLYSETHKKYHPLIRSYLEKFEFYDIFLVDNESGHIIYSVYKEVDYGTSLIDGPYSNSNLARAYQEAKKSNNKDFVRLVDFEAYHPSYNAPASFIASPIYEGDEQLGVLIFQMPIKKINDIMTNRHEWANVGLGESGETYLVAEDYTLRNQSRFFIEDRENYFKMVTEIGTPESTITQIKNFESTVGLQTVKTKGTISALEGKTDTEIFDDYRGVAVLSSYKPLEIEDMNWVIMSEIDKDEAFSHVYDLRKNILVVFVGLLLAIIFAAFFVSNKITRPIKRLTAKAEEIADGNLDIEIPVGAGDEIGTLSKSFSHMQHSIKDLVQNLEEKVEERTKELQSQKEMVEEKNREIVDSINYALRLQRAIIPTAAKVKTALPESFVYFKPKDIVSGDFYWMNEVDGQVLIGAIDCTGHGVPGAMVSVVGANGLNRCVKEFNLRQPAAILDKLTDLVKETFESGEDKVKDGMDGALCSIDLEKNIVQYAGAHNPLWVIKADAEDVEEIKADKQPIGDFDFRKPFTNHTLQLSKGDQIYFFSDGYVDQFGGPKGKKFKYKTLKKLLFEIREKSMEEQMQILDKTFKEWKRDLEQLDDVCIIGVKL